MANGSSSSGQQWYDLHETCGEGLRIHRSPACRGLLSMPRSGCGEGWDHSGWRVSRTSGRSDDVCPSACGFGQKNRGSRRYMLRQGEGDTGKLFRQVPRIEQQVAWIRVPVFQDDGMAQQIRALQLLEPQVSGVLPFLAEEQHQVDSDAASWGIGEPSS